MAAGSSVQSLQEEATCSVCLDFFRDPVMIMGCGHNFCRACITQCWEGAETDVTCPQCRQTFPQRTLGPNRQLANFVEIAKQLCVQAVKGAGGERVCEEHGKALKLFCETDQILMCVICRESRAHRTHPAAPAQEPAQQYKEQIQTHLEVRRQERKRLEALRANEKQKHQEYQEKAEVEKQKIVAEFERLRQFLEEQERLLLAKLGELEREIEKSQEERDTKLTGDISCLSSLIGELEGKCQQAASDLLQDIRSTLSRCEKGQVQLPVGISQEIETRLRKLSGQNLNLKETLRQFQEALLSELEKESYAKVTVTLDPDTAHPDLILSVGGRSVSCAETQQCLPNNSERFDVYECVLGHERFTSGRHYWEVEVEEGEWAVGVARESVRRKEDISLSPEEGIWAVVHCDDQLWALTTPDLTLFCLCWVPSRVRVCLDYTAGLVSFLDADTEASIFTFPPALFAGDTIRPWLGALEAGSKLRLCN
ncbi:zinc finger protein RFP-like [Alligator sinensis]|uniref:Zinc finger protein RFP-like n=1 Tax=Alligator sinensis TaxID=38654 RepID=A0A3Q0FKJ4_ALLSI|nr:zinc finger protein RFP-like [Alligator sinensis]